VGQQDSLPSITPITSIPSITSIHSATSRHPRTEDRDWQPNCSSPPQTVWYTDMESPLSSPINKYCKTHDLHGAHRLPRPFAPTCPNSTKARWNLVKLAYMVTLTLNPHFPQLPATQMSPHVDITISTNHPIRGLLQPLAPSNFVRGRPACSPGFARSPRRLPCRGDAEGGSTQPHRRGRKRSKVRRAARGGRPGSGGRATANPIHSSMPPGASWALWVIGILPVSLSVLGPRRSSGHAAAARM